MRKIRKNVFIMMTLAVVMVVSVVGVYAETLEKIDRKYEFIIKDDFEKYNNIDEIKEVYKRVSRVEISNEQNRTEGGSKSLKITPEKINEAFIFINDGDSWDSRATQGAQGRASVWLYTSSESWHECAVFYLYFWTEEGKRHEMFAGIGNQPQFTMPEYFVVRDTSAADNPGWRDTSAKWSAGWHEFVYDVTLEHGTRLYIDGILVYQNSNYTAFHAVALADKWGSNDPSYFDDLEIVKYLE
jgi:hypothetical protein